MNPTSTAGYAHEDLLHFLHLSSPPEGRAFESRRHPKTNLSPNYECVWNEGNMNITSVKIDCSTSGCENWAMIVLEGQQFCLDHFFSSCYARLDQIEPLVRRCSLDASEAKAVRGFLQECSDRALFISLRYDLLTNLERSRLLEILLSCSELQLLLRRLPPEFSNFVSRVQSDLASRDCHPKNEEATGREKRAIEGR